MMNDSEKLLGAGGSEDEGAGLVVVFRALFPGWQAGEDDCSALEAFRAVDGMIIKRWECHFRFRPKSKWLFLLGRPSACFLYTSF